MSWAQNDKILTARAGGYACHPANLSCTSTCTGMYGRPTVSPWTGKPALGANVEDMLVVKLKQYLLWTQQDERVVGWNAWHYQVSKAPTVGPEAGPASAFYSHVPTGMHGPTGTCWADLTRPLSRPQSGRRGYPADHVWGIAAMPKLMALLRRMGAALPK
jgi:hypothetical protein